jgi:hypothetical protein
MKKSTEPESNLSTAGIAAWMVSAGGIFLLLVSLVTAHGINQKAKSVFGFC